MSSTHSGHIVYLLMPSFRNNHISVSVFMREISYEHHEQQRQIETADLLSTWRQLVKCYVLSLGNIAGSMGLFLGMSCVTLLEIFIYLFKSVYGAMNTERQRQFVKSQIEEEKERRQSMRAQEPVVTIDDIVNDPGDEGRQEIDVGALAMQPERVRRLRESFKRYGKTGPFGRKRTSTIGSMYLDEKRPLKRRQSTLPPLLTELSLSSKPSPPLTAPAVPSESGNKNVFFLQRQNSKPSEPASREARRLSTCPISIVAPLSAQADDRPTPLPSRTRHGGLIRRSSTIPKKHLEIPIRRRTSVQAQPGNLLMPRPSHARIAPPPELTSTHRRQSIWDVSAASARRGYMPGSSVLRRPSNLPARDGVRFAMRPRSTTYQSENRLI